MRVAPDMPNGQVWTRVGIEIEARS